jgi:hypothetical protein
VSQLGFLVFENAIENHDTNRLVARSSQVGVNLRKLVGLLYSSLATSLALLFVGVGDEPLKFFCRSPRIDCPSS